MSSYLRFFRDLQISFGERDFWDAIEQARSPKNSAAPSRTEKKEVRRAEVPKSPKLPQRKNKTATSPTAPVEKTAERGQVVTAKASTALSGQHLIISQTILSAPPSFPSLRIDNS